MNDCYVDYDYYINDFNGNIIPNTSFNKFVKKASRKINYYTSNNIKEVTNDIRDATCEIAELLFNQNKLKEDVLYATEVLKSSETVGPWTVHYENNTQYKSNKILSESELNNLIYRICKDYLLDKGLMFRG